MVAEQPISPLGRYGWLYGMNAKPHKIHARHVDAALEVDGGRNWVLCRMTFGCWAFEINTSANLGIIETPVPIQMALWGRGSHYITNESIKPSSVEDETLGHLEAISRQAKFSPLPVRHGISGVARRLIRVQFQFNPSRVRVPISSQRTLPTE